MILIVFRRKTGDFHNISGMRRVDKVSAAYVDAAVTNVASAAIREEDNITGLESG